MSLEFLYGGIDLASISGPDLFGYALNVTKSIFSKDELANGIIADDNNKTRSKKRTVLDEKRIRVLKGRCLEPLVPSICISLKGYLL